MCKITPSHTIQICAWYKCITNIIKKIWFEFTLNLHVFCYSIDECLKVTIQFKTECICLHVFQDSFCVPLTNLKSWTDSSFFGNKVKRSLIYTCICKSNPPFRLDYLLMFYTFLYIWICNAFEITNLCLVVLPLNIDRRIFFKYVGNVLSYITLHIVSMKSSTGYTHSDAGLESFTVYPKYCIELVGHMMVSNMKDLGAHGKGL